MCLAEDPFVSSSGIDVYGKDWGIGLDKGVCTIFYRQTYRDPV
jgi:hypothetical protein